MPPDLFNSQSAAEVLSFYRVRRMVNLDPQCAGQPSPQLEPEPCLDGHLVHVYQSDASLADVVADFLAAGLLAGQPVVVIATEPHVAAFRSRLSALGVDAGTAVDQGRLRFIDAHAMLDKFMVAGEPDRARFHAHVGTALDQDRASGTVVRAYGEMVDILWQTGRQSAALLLEEMWNQLATVRRFSLLCAYTMGNFYGQSGSDGLRKVCELHRSGLHRSGSPGTAPDPRTLALEAEIRERRRLEEALRQCLAEQHRVEAELRDRNADLRDFFENAVEGLHCVGPDGTILWANSAELSLLGYSRDEYVGRHIAEFHVDADVIAEMLQRLARNETLRDWQARLRCKDGSIKHVRISTNARFRDGELVHTRCFTRDVTEETLAREETSGLLEALVDEARAKDEFIAMLSHELRGPLAPIRSALQLMRLRGDSGVTREREIVDRQVANLIRLVDDLLDASRIATGKVELHRDRLDVADAIDMAVEIAAPTLDARGHALHVRASRGVAFVDGDAVRLAQIVSNLLSNAAKYTERSGRISVDLRAEDGQAVISVRDTGVGIEAELLARVFERGVQAAPGLGGLGLGLTIVRALVELHGGVVTAHSEGRGRGSEFRVRLPLAEPPASEELPARSEANRPASPTASPVRLLIVDDDPDLADTLAELLARRGFVTRVARDGEEALRAFAQFRPQAALIDISLPMMNGRDLARCLREIGTDAKLIALSGYGRREDEEASLASGFDVHLIKPVRPDVIEAHLRGIGDDSAC